MIHTGDVEHGGTLKVVIAAVGSPLAQANEDTRIIPGLGALKAAVKRASEALAEAALDELEAEWGGGNFTDDRWIPLIYDGI